MKFKFQDFLEMNTYKVEVQETLKDYSMTVRFFDENGSDLRHSLLEAQLATPSASKFSVLSSQFVNFFCLYPFYSHRVCVCVCVSLLCHRISQPSLSFCCCHFRVDFQLHFLRMEMHVGYDDGAERRR